MMNTRAQWKLLHTWITLVIVQQHLVQIDRIDGPAEHSLQIIAAVRSLTDLRDFEARSLAYGGGHFDLPYPN